MTRFIALPVGQGDAFYLETKAGSVLVDGGRAIYSFASLFRTYTERDGVDVLIATHNDADHANGILGFLKAGLQCQEVWLPGRWAQVLPLVLRPWEEVIDTLTVQVKEVTKHIENMEVFSEDSFLERYADIVGRKYDEKEPEDKRLAVGEGGWPVEIIHKLEATSQEEDEWEWPIWRIVAYHRFIEFFFVGLDTLRSPLLGEALAAARRIRQIALEAYHRGVQVRWFEWNPQNPGGGLPWLTPLNNREIAQVRIAREQRFLELLSLTVWNRESLVFWVPPNYSGGGVLFTADSDLKDVNLKALEPLDGAIVTAPHHGSCANAKVYKRISTITENVIWVRSDGRFRKRPCVEYLQAPGYRYCTLCRNPNSKKQTVIFLQRNRTWVPEPWVKPCICI